MYSNFSKVTEIKSFETNMINKYLDNGWIIINTFQFANGEDAYGCVLLGLPTE